VSQSKILNFCACGFTALFSIWCAAMAIGLGGNPYGPAGTGKTESVKALGGLFGRQVLVFNCDEVKLCSVMRSGSR